METNDITTFPKQKIPTSQKNDEWIKASARHIISNSNFNTLRSATVAEFYRAYNGEIDESVYGYVKNPYNSRNPNYTRFPAKLRNYNIIKPAIDLLLGEKRNRPLNWQVIAKNPESISEYENFLAEQHIANAENIVVRSLMALGNVDPEELPEIMSQKEIDVKSELSYKDRRALMGHNAMEYIWENQRLEENYQTCFFDWLVAGETFTFKDVVHDEVLHEPVSPIDIDYADSPSLKYIEDSDWVIRRMLKTVNEISDMFYDEPGFDKILGQIEGPLQNRQTQGFFTPFVHSMRDTRAFNSNASLMEVLHVSWKSFDKYGVLTYDDGFGPVETLVSDDYIFSELDGDISIDWIWLSRIYNVYVIDNKHFVKGGPLPLQRNSMTVKTDCKHQYNGKVYSNRHAQNISTVKIGLVYQILYNIVHYRMELTLAKNKDKIMLMEYNAIPKKHGWDEDKFMYYADAMGIAFIDTLGSTEGKSLTSFNQFQVLDMSLGQYIESSFNLLTNIRTEWEETLGINRQRKGQQSASDGLGVTQEAIFRSSVITEELFSRFDDFMEIDCQGILDYSRIAWKNGKKERYVRSTGEVALLDIDPELYPESDLGIFFKNSNKEHEKLQTLKQLAGTFAQNSTLPSQIAEILDSENFAEIKSELRKLEQKQQELDQQAAERQGEQQQELQQMANQALQEERSFKADENQKDRDHELNLKLIDADIKLAGLDLNNNGIPDSSEVERNAIERIKAITEDNFKKRQLQQKDKELELKNKEIDTRNEMNKRDNETKLKNPVAGEKKKK